MRKFIVSSVCIFILLVFSSCETLQELGLELEAAFSKPYLESRSNKPDSDDREATPIRLSEDRLQESELVDRLREDGWNLELIDTARDVDYLSVSEKDVVLAMNAARVDPQKFNDLYVQEIKRYYSGPYILYPGEVRIITSEGIAAVNELDRFLRDQKGLQPLVPSLGMSQAAADHSQDQSRSGATGHGGSDGSNPFGRMNRYGNWKITAGENISYGKMHGLRIVLQLLIDDGVPSRGHRTNIYNPDFSVTGVGIDSHPAYGVMCTIEYAGGFK